MTVRLEPGAVVRFICDSETITGSQLSMLMVGRIVDRPVFPCALRVIIPVEVDVGERHRILWVSDDQVLTVEDDA